MYGLFSPFTLILLIIWVMTSRKLSRLTARVNLLESKIGAGNTVPTTHSSSTPVEEKSASKDSMSSTPLAPEHSASQRLLLWMKEDWLLKMGGLLVLLGFGWLTTFAFMNNWIGPMGRIGLGIIAGTLILILGTWRIRTQVHQGGVFLVVGSTTILLTVFAARQYYDFFTPTTGLGIMFFTSAYVALVSVQYNNRALSLASVILAGIAPLLTNSSTNNFIALFAYLLVVILGTVWIVAVTQQRGLTGAGLLVVAMYSMPQLLSPTAPDELLMFAYAFAAIFFVTNTVGIVKIQDKKLTSDMVIAAGNGLFLLVWILIKAPEEWKSLIIAGWMIAFVAGAFIVFTLTKKREPFLVYAGVGFAMLAAATAEELQGASLTIAFTIEVALTTWLVYQLTHDKKIADRLCLLFILPVFLSIESLNSSLWSQRVLHEDFFVILILAIALLGLGIFFSIVTEQQKLQKSMMPTLLVIVGSGYSYALLWLSLHAALFSSSLAVMTSLLCYTIIGLITYFMGKVRGKRGLGHYGGILLACVIARLLLVDVWEMPLSNRIITFFVVGILLMGTAFYGRSHSASSHLS